MIEFFRSQRILLQALLIAAASLWIYSPAWHGGWLMDDRLYLPENPLLHDPARLWKTWAAPGQFIEYYPVGQTVQWIQWQLWGPDTFGYHLTNVVLHIANALLVWRLLTKFGLKLAWLGGLLFVIHPVHVESVAWIAELKNTLSLAPFLLAMCYWIDYEEHAKTRDYSMAVGFFLVAMLCKISMAPFPALILLYAWWKRRRITWNDLKAATPFLIISIGMISLTILSGEWFRQIHHTLIDPIPVGGFASRLACSGMALSFYFFQVFWPLHLLPFYRQWTLDPLAWWEFLPVLILATSVVWFWTKRQTWGRHVLLGLGFYILFIAPFLGFIGATYMSFTRVMDHFLYLPSIGLIGLTVAVMEQIAERLSTTSRPIGIGIVAVIVGALTLESHAYARAFVDRETNNLYVITRDPDVWIAHNNLGVIYLQAGRLDEAAAQFQQAVTLNPNYATAYNGLGNALTQMGRPSDAIVQYWNAININKGYAEAHNGLANALLQTGELPEAMDESQEALSIDPDYPLAYCTMGLVYVKYGKLPEALDQFETAQKLAPGNPKIEQAITWIKGLQVQSPEKK